MDLYTPHRKKTRPQAWSIASNRNLCFFFFQLDDFWCCLILRTQFQAASPAECHTQYAK